MNTIVSGKKMSAAKEVSCTRPKWSHDPRISRGTVHFPMKEQSIATAFLPGMITNSFSDRKRNIPAK
jgi:hypothetical protein